MVLWLAGELSQATAPKRVGGIKLTVDVTIVLLVRFNYKN
jgi:hypothetical protein